MRTGIYKIRNVTRGIDYIGASVNIDKRIKKHFSDLNSFNHFCKKMNVHYKIMKDHFIWGVIEYCSVSQLKKREKHHWKMAYDGMLARKDPIYNMSTPGYFNVNNKTTWKDVQNFCINTQFHVFEDRTFVHTLSFKELQSLYGIAPENILNLVSGSIKTYNGYDVRMDPGKKIWKAKKNSLVSDLIDDPFLTFSS